MGSTHRRQRGAALLEMAIVSLLLFALLFGIISYAYMMSFRSSLTQATAEGARAGAVTPASFTDPQKIAAAQAALDQAIGAHGVTCTSTGMTCSITIATCPNSAQECVTVTTRYAYRANPRLPAFPGLGLTLPENLQFTSVAEIN